MSTPAPPIQMAPLPLGSINQQQQQQPQQPPSSAPGGLRRPIPPANRRPAAQAMTPRSALATPVQNPAMKPPRTAGDGFRTHRTATAPERTTAVSPIGDGRSIATRTALADASLADQIDLLQNRCELYTKKIEVERRHVTDLERKLKLSLVKLEEQRRGTKGLRPEERTRAAKQRLVTAENRLNKVLVRYNQSRSHNQTMKEAIENLRRDKLQREQIKKRLERELTEQQRALQDSITQFQVTVDARDRAGRQVGALEQTMHAELSEFEAEFSSRVQTVSSERAQARQQRLTAQSVASLAHSPSRAEERRPDAPQAGGMKVEQEAELKHKSTKAFWDIAKREVQLRSQTALLQQYEEAYAKIRASTGINTVDEMVVEFLNAEDANFSLINMINDLNREIEGLEVQNSRLESQLSFVKDKGQTSERERARLFKEMEDQINALEQKQQQYQAVYDSAMVAIASMKPGLLNMFQKVGCADDAMAENVLATGITDGNVLMVLGIIEQRVAEIVQLNELALGSLQERTHATIEPSPVNVGVPVPPSMQEVGDESDDDFAGDDAGAPVSTAELKNRVARQYTSQSSRRPFVGVRTPVMRTAQA